MAFKAIVFVAIILAFAVFTAEGFRGCKHNSKLYRNGEVVDESADCGIKLVCRNGNVIMVPFGRRLDSGMHKDSEENAKAHNGNVVPSDKPNYGCWFNGKNWNPRDIVYKTDNCCCFVACVNRARESVGYVRIFRDPDCS